MLENYDRPKTAYCPFPPFENLGLESLNIYLNHGNYLGGVLVYLVDLLDWYSMRQVIRDPTYIRSKTRKALVKIFWRWRVERRIPRKVGQCDWKYFQVYRILVQPMPD